MRLDKYLKVSRIIKRASYDVKIGDKIEVALGQNRHTYLVKAVQEHALKEDAALMYEPLD